MLRGAVPRLYLARTGMLILHRRLLGRRLPPRLHHAGRVVVLQRGLLHPLLGVLVLPRLLPLLQDHRIELQRAMLRMLGLRRGGNRAPLPRAALIAVGAVIGGAFLAATIGAMSRVEPAIVRAAALAGFGFLIGLAVLESP